MLERLRKPWPDHRAERTLGAVSLLVGVGVVAMVVFVVTRAWPLFEHNGLSWLLGGGDFEAEVNTMTAATTKPAAAVFHLRAWPLIYGTLLSTAIAVVLGLTIAFGELAVGLGRGHVGHGAQLVERDVPGAAGLRSAPRAGSG